MENYRTVHENEVMINPPKQSIADKKEIVQLQLLNNLKMSVFQLDRFTPLSDGNMLEDLEGEYVLVSSVLNLFSAKI